MLAELDPKLEPINMGQVGYGVDQAYLWYRRDADDLDVDVHILAFTTHDLLRMQSDKFMGIPRPMVILKDGTPVVANVPISEPTYAMPVWLAEILNRADGLRTVKLATAIRKKLDVAPRKVPGAVDARGAEEVKTVVARLFEDLRDYDSARSRTTVLVYFPSLEELQRPTGELEYWLSFVRSNARRLDIPFIDFVSLFAELPAADVTRLFVDGYHFSEWGHALVARELLRGLRDDSQVTGRSTARRGSTGDQPTPTPAGTPNGHVVPSDVGNTIGVGVVAPVPTTPYTGPSTVSTNGMLIENVVISGEQIFITGDNVTLRNVIIDVDDWNGITFAGANNARLEYSKIHNSRYGKAIKLEGGIGIHIENNEISGGQDFFFFTYDLDEVYIENNYMHHVVGDEDAHCDGFQWFESFDNQNFYIRGNYITANNPEIGMTDLLVVTDPTANVLFENNYLGLFGFYTLRWCAWCSGDFTIQNNVYAQEFKTAFTEPGYPTHAIDSDHPTAGGVYRCNRYEDGDFIEQTYVRGVTHDTTGCPSYP